MSFRLKLTCGRGRRKRCRDPPDHTEERKSSACAVQTSRRLNVDLCKSRGFFKCIIEMLLEKAPFTITALKRVKTDDVCCTFVQNVNSIPSSCAGPGTPVRSSPPPSG